MILTFFVLDLCLDILDGVGRLHFQCDGLSGQGLDENLHTTTQTKNQVEGRLLLDIVVAQSAAVFELLSSENQTLLIRRNSCSNKTKYINMINSEIQERENFGKG